MKQEVVPMMLALIAVSLVCVVIFAIYGIFGGEDQMTTSYDQPHAVAVQEPVLNMRLFSFKVTMEPKGTPTPAAVCEGVVMDEYLTTYREKWNTVTGNLGRGERVIILAISLDKMWLVTNLGWVEANGVEYPETCSIDVLQ